METPVRALDLSILLCGEHQCGRTSMKAERMLLEIFVRRKKMNFLTFSSLMLLLPLVFKRRRFLRCLVKSKQSQETKKDRQSHLD